MAKKKKAKEWDYESALPVRDKYHEYTVTALVELTIESDFNKEEFLDMYVAGLDPGNVLTSLKELAEEQSHEHAARNLKVSLKVK